MYAYGWAPQTDRDRKFAAPSEELRVAVTFRRRDQGPSLTKFGAPLPATSVLSFLPEPAEMDRAINELSKLGFRLTWRGRLSASMRCRREDLQKAFQAKLVEKRLSTKEDYSFYSFYSPMQGTDWKPRGSIVELIDDVYVQWPHIYITRKRATASNTPKKSSRPARPGRPPSKPPLAR